VAEIVLEHSGKMKQERRPPCLLNFLTPQPYLPEGLSISCMYLFSFPIQQHQPAKAWLVGCATNYSSGLPLLTKKECPNHFQSPFSGMKLTARSSPTASLSLNADAWRISERTTLPAAPGHDAFAGGQNVGNDSLAHSPLDAEIRCQPERDFT
jgi:hypothetical protein